MKIPSETKPCPSIRPPRESPLPPPLSPANSVSPAAISRLLGPVPAVETAPPSMLGPVPDKENTPPSTLGPAPDKENAPPST